MKYIAEEMHVNQNDPNWAKKSHFTSGHARHFQFKASPNNFIPLSDPKKGRKHLHAK